MQVQSIPAPAGGQVNQSAEPDVASLLNNPELLRAALTALTEKLSGQLVPAQQVSGDPRPDLKPLLTPKQVTDLTGISRSEIHRMLQSGALPSSRVGEGTKCVSRRVPKALILGFLADQAAGKVVSLREYADSWKKSIAAPSAVPAAVAS